MATFTFNATFFGPEGIESEVLTIQAESQAAAEVLATREINGVNSFAECLIDLELLGV